MEFRTTAAKQELFFIGVAQTYNPNHHHVTVIVFWSVKNIPSHEKLHRRQKASQSHGSLAIFQIATLSGLLSVIICYKVAN